MELNDLIREWEAEADRLIQAAKHFQSQCNAGQRASRIGKAAGLKAAAEKLRQYQSQNVTVHGEQ